jgi:hypothetical protein
MPTFPTLSPELRHRLLAPPSGPARAVLDTDTFNEIDDQFAIVQALLSAERIKLEAIYAAPFLNDRATSPGHGMELSVEEILRLLDRMGRPSEGLVHRGVTGYVQDNRAALRAGAVDDLIARARSATPEAPLYVIAIAAISNITSALMLAPDIVDRTVIVWLGGHALHWPHTREFNLRQDVFGTQILLDSGAALVLVPCMGVTSHLLASVPEIERYVEPHGAIGAFLSQRFKEYNSSHTGWSKEIWDMAAVAWLLDPSWVPTVVVPAPILTTEFTWSVDASRPVIRVATHVLRNSILKDFYSKLSGEHGGEQLDQGSSRVGPLRAAQ